MRDIITKEGLDWEVDSAGTSGWHIGEKPHEGSIAIARQNGIDISRQRSRKFSTSDFNEFDLIIPMDRANKNDLFAMADNDISRNKVRMIMDFVSPGENINIPDPYYDNSFGRVFDMLKIGCQGIADSIDLD
jgi:protein-tyrosine phosphatase